VRSCVLVPPQSHTHAMADSFIVKLMVRAVETGSLSSQPVSAQLTARMLSW